jgi:hypothetical protein
MIEKISICHFQNIIRIAGDVNFDLIFPFFLQLAFKVKLNMSRLNGCDGKYVFSYFLYLNSNTIKN